ncbi:hypothetical protein BX666DRAFT_2026806 [Dichotomocladium elegans]|nr:hypothetical protein BX666DRAFT_2026806 [Dichotomocladium elegans]
MSHQFSATNRLRAVAKHLSQSDEYTPAFEKRNPITSTPWPVYANKTAVVHGDRSYTYSIFADRVHRLANVLIVNFGVKPGDRVAILLQNVPAFLDCKFGVPSAGGVLVPLNTRLTAPEIDYILEHSGATVLIAQQELLARVSPEALGRLKRIEVAGSQNKSDPPCPYEELLARTKPQIAWNDLPLVEDENSIISLNYTSGSTGRPKGVMVSYRGCYMNGISMCITTRLTPETVYLWTLPMFHCNGWSFPWALVAAGAKQVMLNSIDYSLIWRLFKEQGITHYCGAPTVQNEICNHKDAVRLEQKVLTFGGGAALSSTHIRRLRSLNIEPTHLYGLTETYGPTSATYDAVSLESYSPEDHSELVARQGYNHAIVDELRVLDRETGTDVKPDGKHVGEICVSGNTTMHGYYNDPEETKKAFRGGVFWTGDLAVRHPDGAVEIVDRSKDVIVSGGENISSIEVEAAILKMDVVSECAIIGGPDDKWGERPWAFVVLRPNNHATVDQVITHCRKNLAGYKCPSRVIFTDSIPKTSTGKYQKFLLREKLWTSYEKRIN